MKTKNNLIVGIEPTSFLKGTIQQEKNGGESIGEVCKHHANEIFYYFTPVCIAIFLATLGRKTTLASKNN